MSIDRDVAAAASRIRSLASMLHSGAMDPDGAISKMKQVADELDRLVSKIRRALRRE